MMEEIDIFCGCGSSRCDAELVVRPDFDDKAKLYSILVINSQGDEESEIYLTGSQMKFLSEQILNMLKEADDEAINVSDI